MIVTVIGGSGFLGGYIVDALAKEGHVANIASRNPNVALQYKTGGLVGQVATTPCTIRDLASVKRAIAGSDAVVNAVGILYQKGKQQFGAMHAVGAENVAKAAAELGIKRLVHISALGVDKATTSTYARTKMRGEKAVMAAFPKATILRPSVLFGPEDDFFNRFAAMACISPFLPLIGGGNTRFQPVYAYDVARAVVAALQDNATEGTLYELGGPQVYRFKYLMVYLLQVIKRKCLLLPIPFFMAGAMGAVAGLLPTPPLTRDQVRLLQYDNVVSDGAPGFAALGITPERLENVVPGYLERFCKS